MQINVLLKWLAKVARLVVNFEVVFIRKNLFSCNVPLMTYYLSVMLVVYSEKVACWSEKGNDDALLLIYSVR